MSLQVHTMDQRSPEWYEARRGIVTASTVAKLLTPTLKVADNDTSRAAQLALIAERISGQVDETPITGPMLRGIELEPFARDEYEKHYHPVTQTGFMVRNDWGFPIGASPDGLVEDDGLTPGPGMIEIKCPLAKEHLRTILADEPPKRYMPQLQTAMLVAGRGWVDYVSYYPGMPLYVTTVAANEKWQRAIVEAVERFEEAAERITGQFSLTTADLHATEPLPDLDQIVI